MVMTKRKIIQYCLYAILLVIFLTAPVIVETAWSISEDPNYGQSYIKKPKKEIKPDKHFLRKRIAVSRINDGTIIDGSPFGETKTKRVKQENGTYTEELVLVQNDDRQKQSKIGLIMNGFTERLITNLFETKNFIVLEREDIHKILREQDFQNNGKVSKETIVKDGRILGVQYLITGSIFLSNGEEKDDVEKKSDWHRFPNTRIGVTSKEDEKPAWHKFPGSNTWYKDKEYEEKEDDVLQNRVKEEDSFYALHVRVYDVTTSQVVAATRIVGQSQWGLIDGAVKNIVKLLKQEPWKGKVTDIDVPKNIIYFSGGQDVGMETGRMLTIVTRGKPIIDPDGGFILGYIENDVGRIKVTEVKEKYSIGEIIEKTSEMKAGDSLNPKKGDYVVDKL